MSNSPHSLVTQGGRAIIMARIAGLDRFQTRPKGELSDEYALDLNPRCPLIKRKLTMQRGILFACSVILVCWATSESSATMLPGVTIDDYSSQWSAGRAATFLVDGSGLSS